MSVEYVLDPDGVVHVMAPGGGDEFTMCGRTVDGDDTCAGFLPCIPEQPLRSSSCEFCREAVDGVRRALHGVRWSGDARRDFKP